MAERFEFETPENVLVQYELAGLGSRFIALLVDEIIFGLLLFGMFIALLVLGITGSQVFNDLEKALSNTQPGQAPQFPMYLIGLGFLVWGLGRFVYYGLSEYFLQGQTIGKRQVAIRVSKADGFALDGTSILIRNIFRIIDHLPILWIVPLVSAKSQRFGDLVAGTVVVKDAKMEINRIRDVLLARPQSEAAFSFDVSSLKKVPAKDFDAIEKVLERWHSLQARDRGQMLKRMSESLADLMGRERPEPNMQRRFLEDLLSAEYRRQYKKLG